MKNSISLKKSKNIKLFNRVEKKYQCTKPQLYSLISLLKENYSLVTDDDDEENFIFKYHSIYFDTPNMTTFNDHDTDKGHRQKIRIREYENGEKFLEIKDKNENGFTKKDRISVNSFNINDEEKKWIKDNLIYDSSSLNKTLDIKYNRITFISNDKLQRITIDFDIEFYNYINDISKKIDSVIIEVKDKNTTDTISNNLEKIFQELEIKRIKFSKYHQGIKNTMDAV